MRAQRILKTWNETPDVRVFRLEKPPAYTFSPGQFVMIAFEDNPEEKRPFTIASAPTDNYIELLVKGIGEFTKRLLTFKENQSLLISKPHKSNLDFDIDDSRPAVLIAGGSGIAPFMSFLRYAVAVDSPTEFLLFNFNRTEDDIPYKKKIEEFKKKDTITIINGITRGEWEGVVGYMNSQLIEKHIPQPKELRWYLCGTPELVNAVRNLLLQIGVPEKNMFFESWLIPGKKG